MINNMHVCGWIDYILKLQRTFRKKGICDNHDLNRFIDNQIKLLNYIPDALDHKVSFTGFPRKDNSDE